MKNSGKEILFSLFKGLQNSRSMCVNSSDPPCKDGTGQIDYQVQ